MGSLRERVEEFLFHEAKLIDEHLYDADAIGDGELTGREGVFVDEGKNVAVRHFFEFAEAEAEQDALFDPGVDGPACADSFSSADFAARQPRTKIEKRSPRIRGICNRFDRRQGLDGRPQRGERSCVRVAFGSRKDGASGAKARSQIVSCGTAEAVP